MNNYESSTTQVAGDIGRAPSSTSLAHRLADAVDAARADVGARWWQATRTASSHSGERGRATRREASATVPGESLVAAMSAALRPAHRWHDQVMRAGWEFGVLAHSRRVPLYFVLEDLDILAGMIIERSRELVAGTASDATAAEALSTVGRDHDAAKLLRLSAVKGYTLSVSDEMKRRFRTLRHDLRNPLGTIKSALALMEDETIPAETRESPRFRAMARRNASSMEAMIRTTLGDAAALLPAFAHEPVSLRSIAAAVRRDLRADAEAREIRIVIGDRLPTVRIDSAGFELTLRSAVAAVLRGLTSPAEVVIDLAQISDQSASVRVSVLPEGSDHVPLDAEDLAFARELAERTGGRVLSAGPGRQVCVEVPISVGGGEQTHDVGGASERHHR